jgi:hypothetical protein
MGSIKVLGGDFVGDGYYASGRITLRRRDAPRPAHRMVVRDFFRSIELAAQQDVVKVGGAVGWGAAGAILGSAVGLTPAGLLAGALLGGRGKKVTFLAELVDGRRFLAQTDPRTFTSLRADLV